MSNLSVSGIYSLYDVAKVEDALSVISEKESPSQKKLYEKMLRIGPDRWASRPSSEDELDALLAYCPNFQEVVLDLKKYIALTLFGGNPFNFMPILLAGDPGVGKTHFARLLATYLKTEYHYLSMASVSAGFVLSGSASTFSGAKAGKVATALVMGPIINPIILLDELDKTSGSRNHDPLGPLYQLLERETAKSFVDEFIDIPVDASQITWVATANDLGSIPAPILSRMAVYEIPKPTKEQAITIARNLYDKVLEENGWAFDPMVSEEVLSCLAQSSPREMRKRILDALGSARLDKRVALQPKDVRVGWGVNKKKPMGFIEG